MRRTLRFASIIVTYRCNARCHMCHTWQHPTKKGEEITSDDLAALPAIPSINLTGGEPFLREDLGELLSVLQPKTERLVISTNGYFTERIIDVAQQHPWIGIRVSIEGLPKANDELRGIADGFDHGLRTLLELHRLGLKDIGFGITLSDRNVSDLLELYQLADMMGVEFATAAVHNSFYFHKHDNAFMKPDLAIAELERLIRALLQSRKVKDWFRAYFNYGLVNYIRGNPRLLACEMGHDAFFLDPHGEILPCNVMERSMGNIRERSFDDIWNGEEAQVCRRSVDACRQNCWMIGSVAEPMKKHLAAPLKWIARNKLFAGRP